MDALKELGHYLSKTEYDALYSKSYSDEYKSWHENVKKDNRVPVQILYKAYTGVSLEITTLRNQEVSFAETDMDGRP